MPVYEYKCKACGREFEYQQRMSELDKTTCEACGKDELERLISRTAFSLKGGGWYKDLYSSTKPDSGSGSGGSGTGSGGGDSAATTTPAATPAATPASTTPSTPSGGGGSGSGSGSSGGGTGSAT